MAREVDFSGSITRAPLSLVLQQIADTARLKLIADANGATHVARGSHLTRRQPPQGMDRLDNEVVLEGPAGSLAI